MSAYQRGREAFLRGEPFSNCPRVVDQTVAPDWRSGWLDARALGPHSKPPAPKRGGDTVSATNAHTQARERVARLANGERPADVYPILTQNPSTGEAEEVFDALWHAADIRTLLADLERVDD